MEQKYNTSSLGQEMERLRDFCEREGEAVTFSNAVARLRGVRGIQVCHARHQRRKETHHMVLVRGRACGRLFRFLYGRPAQSTIEAMMPSRVLRVSSEQLERFFSQSIETMKMRALIAEHILCQFHERYINLTQNRHLTFSPPPYNNTQLCKEYKRNEYGTILRNRTATGTLQM